MKKALHFDVSLNTNLKIAKVEFQALTLLFDCFHRLGE